MYFIKDNNDYWSVSVQGRAFHFDPSHPAYDTLIDSIRKSDSEQFLANIDIEPVVNRWGEGDFVCEDGVVKYKGEEIHSVISDRVFDLLDQKLPHQPLLNFVKNLSENPSYRSVNELYTFLEHKRLPITEDGCFTAYKYVTKYNGDNDIADSEGNVITKGDFVDARTGKTHRNNVGDTPSMPRNKVDDNLNHACGSGLHVGSYEFVSGHGYIIICKINPTNVVSIPSDSQCQKVRCCAYEVIGIMKDEQQDINSSPTNYPVVDDSYNDWNPNEDEEDDDCDPHSNHYEEEDDWDNRDEDDDWDDDDDDWDDDQDDWDDEEDEADIPF